MNKTFYKYEHEASSTSIKIRMKSPISAEKYSEPELSRRCARCDCVSNIPLTMCKCDSHIQPVNKYPVGYNKYLGKLFYNHYVKLLCIFKQKQTRRSPRLLIFLNYQIVVNQARTLPAESCLFECKYYCPKIVCIRIVREDYCRYIFGKYPAPYKVVINIKQSFI